MSGVLTATTAVGPIAPGAVYVFNQAQLKAALETHVATLPPFLQPLCRAAVMDFLNGEQAKAMGLTWTPAPITPTR